MHAIPLSAPLSRARPERRRYLRYAVRCECWLESDDASVFGSTADVGLGGLFLRTAIPLREGQRVRVALSLDGSGHAVTAEGLVTRAVRAERGRRHGVGVEFTDISDGREGLHLFLNER
jgi:uncharacterized protein (TIGR02266 family)